MYTIFSAVQRQQRKSDIEPHLVVDVIFQNYIFIDGKRQMVTPDYAIT
jgi:hypothetical protein